jgi:hypothetical protein
MGCGPHSVLVTPGKGDYQYGALVVSHFNFLPPGGKGNNCCSEPGTPLRLCSQAWRIRRGYKIKADQAIHANIHSQAEHVNLS